MILSYIINAALVLGDCLAFYKILLRRKTFHTVNRYMLLVCLLIFLIAATAGATAIVIA